MQSVLESTNDTIGRARVADADAVRLQVRWFHQWGPHVIAFKDHQSVTQDWISQQLGALFLHVQSQNLADLRHIDLFPSRCGILELPQLDAEMLLEHLDQPLLQFLRHIPR